MSKLSVTLAIHQKETLIRRDTFTQDVIRIGSGARCHLRLEDPSVTSTHAVIEVANGSLTLIDLGKPQGTHVNGTRVHQCRLAEGDSFRIGDEEILVERVAESSAFGAPEPRFSALRTAHAELGRHPSAQPTSAGSKMRGAYAYTMIKSGPDVDSDEIELKGVLAVEVMVLWGQNVLHVAHLHAGESFSVGEEQGRDGSCDFFIPAEKLGATRLSIVAGDAVEPLVLIPDAATGVVDMVGQRTMTLSELRAQPHLGSSVAGQYRLPLTRGTSVKLQLADFEFRVAAVAAGKPAEKGLAAATDWRAISFFGLSSGFVGSIVATMAFFMPTLADSEELDVDQNQLYLMQQYLVAAAEREKEATPTEQVADENADDREGGTGTRARGEEGSMGNPNSRAVNRRYAVAGRKDNPDPHLARTAALEEARHFGTIGLLNAGLAGDPNAPTAPWGRDESLGTDEVSYRGNMWGDQLGDAAGSGGLGLSGIGEGGGGIGEGVGLGAVGGLGHGLGTGDGQGIGIGHGRLGRGHSTRPPSRMRPGITQVSGRLPPEVIQRIVRQNYGRFRTCYEQGLARNPNLEGRVQVRFVIDREGMVSNVQNGGSDLPDSGVTSCVMGAYYGLTFPQPEGGIVTVTYPIMFQPG